MYLFIVRRIYKTERGENKLSSFLFVCIYRWLRSWQFSNDISSSYWNVCLRDEYCLVQSWVFLLFLLKFRTYILWKRNFFFFFFSLGVNMFGVWSQSQGYFSQVFDEAIRQLFFQCQAYRTATVEIIIQNRFSSVYTLESVKSMQFSFLSTPRLKRSINPPFLSKVNLLFLKADS